MKGAIKSSGNFNLRGITARVCYAAKKDGGAGQGKGPPVWADPSGGWQFILRDGVGDQGPAARMPREAVRAHGCALTGVPGPSAIAARPVRQMPAAACRPKQEAPSPSFPVNLPPPPALPYPAPASPSPTPVPDKYTQEALPAHPPEYPAGKKYPPAFRRLSHFCEPSQ